jgi:hypothetical protein
LSENYLATIEAIYYLYREYAEAYEMDGKPYDGRYDNLLFYFKFFYNLIQHKYRNGTMKYTHRQREGYIEYDGEKGNSEKDGAEKDDCKKEIEKIAE